MLRVIAAALRRLCPTLGDEVRMPVILVCGRARGGRMDFGGAMAGYREPFGTPARPDL